MFRYVKILLPLMLLMCVSCAKNPYDSFYSPLPSLSSEGCAMPEVRHIENVNADPLDAVIQAWNEGYVLTGYSAWNGTRDYGVSGSEETARAKHACLVVTLKKYERMQKATEVEVWEIFDDYGYRRDVNYNPTVINQYIYMGLYFARLDPAFGSGILPLDAQLADDAHPMPERGVAVLGVRAGSAAANAGIKPGDVLLSVNGKDAGTQILESLFQTGSNTVAVLHDGKRITASCALVQVGKNVAESLRFLRQKPANSLDIMPDDRARTYVTHRVHS